MKIPATPRIELLRPSRRFLVAAALLVSPLFAQTEPSADYLLPDGSFEQTTPPVHWPRHWPNAANVTWESEEGNRFLRLTAPKPNIITAIFCEAPVPMDVTAVELSFRRRVTGLVLGKQAWNDARVMINFLDANGKKTASSRVPYIQRDTNGWQSVTHRLKIPPGTISIEVMPALFRVNAGVFDIDDVVMKSIDPKLLP